MTQNETLKNQIDRVLASEPASYTRLQKALKKVRENTDQKNLFLQFALCARGVSQQAQIRGQHFSAFDPYGMLADYSDFQLCRLYFLLELAEIVDDETFVGCINQLFSTADVNELILLVQALNFFPDPERFVERAREAARSNIVSVFSAIAHKNNYAQRNFDHEGWNQLVLKAAFLAVPLCSIVGLRQRNNAELVTMLKHYVWERQAASRDLPWDIWACIGWQAKSVEELHYLQEQAENLDAFSRAAIALSLIESSELSAEGKQLREIYCSTFSRLDWHALSEAKMASK